MVRNLGRGLEMYILQMFKIKEVIFNGPNIGLSESTKRRAPGFVPYFNEIAITTALIFKSEAFILLGLLRTYVIEGFDI